ncbi:hypothetical protein E0Z10_g1729 [Xylaria hypoxylon]|uniref:Uncharacterized protein n=1 Tax=Xylaria hypoxylon TaxID=37992 RepID=A0A4Z0YRP0_9PEZI|nr:hypothetical protein E0Z10_g1729 [Xylaria hypoxylon]
MSSMDDPSRTAETINPLLEELKKVMSSNFERIKALEAHHAECIKQLEELNNRLTQEVKLNHELDDRKRALLKQQEIKTNEHIWQLETRNRKRLQEFEELNEISVREIQRMKDIEKRKNEILRGAHSIKRISAQNIVLNQENRKLEEGLEEMIATMKLQQEALGDPNETNCIVDATRRHQGPEKPDDTAATDDIPTGCPMKICKELEEFAKKSEKGGNAEQSLEPTSNDAQSAHASRGSHLPPPSEQDQDQDESESYRIYN